jgi:hypothetical protein
VGAVAVGDVVGKKGKALLLSHPIPTPAANASTNINPRNSKGACLFICIYFLSLKYGKLRYWKHIGLHSLQALYTACIY